MTLSEEIREKLIEKGASVVGYADLSALPEDARRAYQYGIIIGVALSPEIVIGIKDGPTLEYYSEYNRLNTLLDQLDEYAAELLREKGFDALPKVQSIVEIDEKSRQTELPHKTVATRAGIGWIGKCALLVTEEYGSAIRISSVLTNAVLDVGEPINTTRCGTCDVCKNICPAGAVTGNSWEVHIDREELYDAHACRNTALARSGKVGVNKSLCGLCILSCPWTKKYLKQYLRKEVTSVTGGLELLPQVKPLWEQLREHHSRISKFFSDSFLNRSFSDRASDFEKKENDHLFRIELIHIGGSTSPIGYCVSSVGNDFAGEVESLFVSSEYRDFGIGDMLMKNALDWMDSKGIVTRRLSVAAGNDSALRFYDRYGFKARTYILEQKAD